MTLRGNTAYSYATPFINGLGASAYFDGTGDFLDFTETTFDIAGTGEELTIAFWAKRTDNNDEAVVLGNSGSGSFKSEMCWEVHF